MKRDSFTVNGGGGHVLRQYRCINQDFVRMTAGRLDGEPAHGCCPAASR